MIRRLVDPSKAELTLRFQKGNEKQQHLWVPQIFKVFTIEDNNKTKRLLVDSSDDYLLPMKCFFLSACSY